MANAEYFGCYNFNGISGRQSVNLKEWIVKDENSPYIEHTGACTVGYLNAIWGASIEQINEVLSRKKGEFGLVFAITGKNNIPHGTDAKLIEIGFKEAFQAPNRLHGDHPVKLWAINLRNWSPRDVKKLPDPVAV